MMSGRVQLNFSLHILFMKMIGFYPVDNHEMFFKLWGLTLYLLSLLPGAVFGSFGFFLKPATQILDYNSFIIIALVIYTFKFFPLLKDNNRIKKCVEFLDSRFFNDIVDEEQALQKSIEESRRNSTFFVSGIILCWIIMSIRPLLRTQNYQLPFDVWLPFEITNKKTHIFVYLYMSLEAGYSSIACVTVDTLIWGLACHATGHLRILKHNLQHLGEEVCEKNAPTKSQINTKAKIMYEKITFCIKYHQAISSFVTRYEYCFSQAIFCELTGNVIIVGLCCLQLSNTSILSINSLTMMVYMCLILFRLFCFCYYGTRIQEESDALITSIYMGNWYNYDAKAKRALILLMESSQKPMIVTVGKLVELSLDTFTTIMKRSYSVLALLQDYS